MDHFGKIISNECTSSIITLFLFLLYESALLNAKQYKSTYSLEYCKTRKGRKCYFGCWPKFRLHVNGKFSYKWSVCDARGRGFVITSNNKSPKIHYFCRVTFGALFLLSDSIRSSCTFPELTRRQSVFTVCVFWTVSVPGQPKTKP